MRYVTGSGMTRQTANRVSIFNKEFGVQPVSRPFRRNRLTYTGHSRHDLSNTSIRVDSSNTNTILPFFVPSMNENRYCLPLDATEPRLELELSRQDNLAAVSNSVARLETLMNHHITNYNTNTENDSIMVENAFLSDYQRIWHCIFNELTYERRVFISRVREGRSMRACTKDIRIVLSMLKHVDTYIYSCYTKIWNRVRLTEQEKQHVAEFLQHVMRTDASAALCVTSIEKLLQLYPEFQDESADEQYCLLRFCNLMRISSKLMKGTLNLD